MEMGFSSDNGWVFRLRSASGQGVHLDRLVSDPVLEGGEKAS